MVSVRLYGIPPFEAFRLFDPIEKLFLRRGMISEVGEFAIIAENAEENELKLLLIAHIETEESLAEVALREISNSVIKIIKDLHSTRVVQVFIRNGRGKPFIWNSLCSCQFAQRAQ